MDFRITGMSSAPFKHLYGLDDAALRAVGVRTKIVDEPRAFPDRIELRDGIPGERFLLLNHEHLPVDSPYRASHAIFIRDGAEDRFDKINEVPELLRHRLLSIRAFDEEHMMIDADVVEGSQFEPVVETMFHNPPVVYLHVHNAKQGCYHARVDRAE